MDVAIVKIKEAILTYNKGNIQEGISVYMESWNMFIEESKKMNTVPDEEADSFLEKIDEYGKYMKIMQENNTKVKNYLKNDK
jgi:hypothetical protein